MNESFFRNEVPQNEIIHPQSLLLLEQVNAVYEQKPEQFSITTESGKLNKVGKELSESTYQEFFNRSNGNYRELLDICRGAEQQLISDEEIPNREEMLRVIKSVRGKAVYHAHKTYAEEKIYTEKFGDESASNVMWYAKVFKKLNSDDVYAKAMQIETQRKAVSEKLREETEQLRLESEAIVQSDLMNRYDSPLEGIIYNQRAANQTQPVEVKQGKMEKLTERTMNLLTEFSTNLLSPSTRRKVVAGALSTLAIGWMLFGDSKADKVLQYIGNLNNKPDLKEVTNIQINKPDQKIESSNRSTESLSEASPFQNPYLNSDAEIPQEEFNQPVIADVEQKDIVQNSQSSSESISYAIPQGSLTIVDSQHPLTEDEIQAEIEPTLINIKETYPNIRVVNENTEVNSVAGGDLNAMLQDAEGNGVSITIRSAYRSIEQQKIAYSQASNKSAVANPGESQHHTGLAIDFTSPEIGNIVDVNAGFENTKAGKWLMENGWKYGFVLAYTNNHDGIHNESWHYFFVGKDLAKVWHDTRETNPDFDLFALQLQFAQANAPITVAFAP